MKFSVFYVLETPDRDFRRAYDEMLAQVEIAEELGFHEVWLAEHHGSDYGSMPSPQIAAAAIAERTERMRIGIAVSNLTFNWPVRIAEDYAMVDVLSGGRLDLGVGRGYQPHEFRAMGAQDRRDVSREVFAEALQIISGLWTKPVGEPYTFIGKHFQIVEADCRPGVLQRPAPPIYIASISPETFDLLADDGHNLLVTPTLMTLPELNGFVVRTKRALLDHGCEPTAIDFPMNWQIHLARDEQTAVERAREPLRWYFDTVMSAIPQGSDAVGYERYAELAASAGEGAMSLDGLREGGVCYLGDPAGLVREIEILREETGLDHLICWMKFGGMAHEHVVESMELLAEHVMPVFADAPALLPRSLRDHTPKSHGNSIFDDLSTAELLDLESHQEGEHHELSRR
ncbi:LLM class flavin-dependent oxidoreductase [Gordonia sp. ABSL49_1]|uniref:LLM class flavin-dependent oxidoreductase n=1 Tax=Gordonia sp. ABSL49_1 TaxID=2920941 RepID=UPI001F10B13D|nr:LLM class flavin-dependent oxidoreductase [Gordonia sp. ABSL49_1]MCH5642147.1 LLM class flavin-dependent oxidoreductase [Gordonia sp. ABSL49_1]